MPPKFRGHKVLIGIIANDAARFSEFGACATRLERPPGSQIEWVIGGDWCAARNELARFTLAGDFTHLWFMDDDHSFAPDLLMRLLAHDVALVNPMCLTRTFPFNPVTYLEDGALDLASVPPDALVELFAGGAAGMLIRRDVLEAIEDPWFEYADESEDVIFCRKAREAGFTLHGDTAARLGHITTAVIWPAYDDELGRWVTGITVGKDMQLAIPLTAELITIPEPEPEVFDSTAALSAQMTSSPLPHFLSPPEETTGLAIAYDLHKGVVGPPPAAGDGVTEPCSICGKQAAWHDRHGQWGCDDHPEGHEAWRTFWERAELWFVPDDNRWYGRMLRGDGSIGIVFSEGWKRQEEAVEFLSREFEGISVHLITSELDDSRRTRTGPPLRLWSTEAT